MCVWDTTGALLFWKHEEHDVELLHFSPTDDNQLVIGAGEEVALWDMENGNEIWSIVASGFAVFSPDARSIACAFPDAWDVHLLDAHTGEFRLDMVGGTGTLCSATFSVDGSKLAVGSYDETCQVWDSSTGALLRTIDVGDCVTSVASGRDWVRDTSAMAFAMGHHPRLGVESRVLALEVGVVRMILDSV